MDNSTNEPEEAPGLPGMRRWRGVYVFVLGMFAVWVALLALLSKVGGGS